MTAPAQQAPTTARTSDAIDPAHAWILGIVVDDDGQFRPAPVAGGPQRSYISGSSADDAPVCTCPDYCQLEHDRI